MFSGFGAADCRAILAATFVSGIVTFRNFPPSAGVVDSNPFFNGGISGVFLVRLSDGGIGKLQSRDLARKSINFLLAFR